MADRFWQFVNKTDGCWLWTGSTDGDDGYGRIKSDGRQKKGVCKQGTIGSHRASWIIHFGAIPEGLEVCHTCDNPPCVRPDHLFLGTTLENQLDCIRKGRHYSGDKKGEKHPMKKLMTSQVIEIRTARASGVTCRELAQQYGMSISGISAVCVRNWKHV